jgi:hypothetical protein
VIGAAVVLAAVCFADQAAAQGRSHGRDLSGINVCGLVSADALMTGLQARRTGPARDASTSRSRACQYRYSMGETNYAPEIAFVPLAEYENVRQRNQGKSLHNLRGLGDAAFAIQSPDGIVLYAVKKYDVAVRVMVEGTLDDADDLLHARALARRALDAIRQ